MRIDCNITEMRLEAIYRLGYINVVYLNIYSYRNRWCPGCLRYMIAKGNKDNYAHHEDIKLHFSSFEDALNYAIEMYGVNNWECLTYHQKGKY